VQANRLVVLCADKASEFHETHRGPAFEGMYESECDSMDVDESALVPEPLVELCRYFDLALAQARFKTLIIPDPDPDPDSDTMVFRCLSSAVCQC
jgi:hypothetical protein